MNELRELLREQRVVVAALKATSRRMKATAQATQIEKPPLVQRLLLLKITESLIDAHKAAKIDDDGHTLDLIEDAMRHVGERLAKETGDGRKFSRKRLQPF